MRKLILGIALFVFLIGCGNSVVPEMKEFMGAFGSKEELVSVVEKYAADPEIVPDALNACELGKPRITNTEQKEGKTIYTVEAVVENCDKSETAVGTIRVFDIAWENGKIISFSWQGPKSGKVEY